MPSGSVPRMLSESHALHLPVLHQLHLMTWDFVKRALNLAMAEARLLPAASSGALCTWVKASMPRLNVGLAQRQLPLWLLLRGSFQRAAHSEPAVVEVRATPLTECVNWTHSKPQCRRPWPRLFCAALQPVWGLFGCCFARVSLSLAACVSPHHFKAIWEQLWATGGRWP